LKKIKAKSETVFRWECPKCYYSCNVIFKDNLENKMTKEKCFSCDEEYLIYDEME